MTEPSSHDRRHHNRQLVHAVVGIDADDRRDRVGVTRNLSPTGALFHSASRFEPGETLELLYREPGSEEDVRVKAKVVRTEIDDPKSGSFFCHLTAVQFDPPVED